MLGQNTPHPLAILEALLGLALDLYSFQASSLQGFKEGFLAVNGDHNFP